MAGEITLKLTIKGGADGSFNATIDSARKSVKGLGDDGDKSSQRVTAGFNGVAKASLNVRTAVDYARSSLLQFASAAAAAVSVRSVMQMADAYTNLSSKIRLVTSSESEAAVIRQSLFQVAQRTRQEFEATAELYTRMARATAALGLSNQQLLGITETINQAFVVSGASAAEASAAIIQLSQGLASGALRGDEFNSVSEQAPIIMELLSQSLGKTRGELRKMAEAGELTAAVLTGALQDGAAGVAAQFAQMDVTVGGAFVQLKNAALEFVGSSTAISGAMNGLVTILQFVANNLDTIATVATLVAGVFTARLTAAALQATASLVGTQLAGRALALEMGYAATSVNVLTASLARLGLNPLALAILGVGAVAYGAVRVIQIAIEQDESFERTIAQIDALDSKSIDIDLAVQFGDAPALKEIESQLAAVRAQADQLWPALDKNRAEVAALQDAWWKTADTWNRINELNAEYNEGLSRQRNLLDWAIKFTNLLTAARERAAATAAVNTAITDLGADAEKQIAALNRQAAAYGKTAAEMVNYDRQQFLLAQSVKKGTALTLDEAAAAHVLFNAIEAAAKGNDAARIAHEARNKVVLAGTKGGKEAARAAEALASANANLTGTLIDLRVENGELTDAQGQYAKGMLEIVATAERLRKAKVDERAITEFLTEAVKAQNTAYADNADAADAAAAAAAERADVIGRLLSDMDQEVYLSGLSTQQRRVEEVVLRAVAEAQEEANRQQDQSIALSAERQAQLRGEVAGQLAQIDALDEAARQQEDYQRIQLNGIDSLSNAIGDFATRNIKTWRDLFGSFKSIALRALSDVVAAFVRQRLLLSVGVGASGTAAAATGAPGAAAAAAGAGGIGGGIGSLLGGIGGLLGGTATGFGTGLLASGSIFSGAGLLGGITGSISAGVASIAGGAITQGIGLLAGPIGLIAGAISIISGLLKNKTPDLRFGGENSNVRKPEGSFSTVFGTVEAGSRLISYEQLIEPIQAFDAGIEQIVNTLGGGSEQLDAIKQRLATWSVDLRGSAATAENVLGSRFSAILETFSADVQGFVGAAGTVEERVKRLGEALTIEALVGDGGLGDTFAAVSSLLSDYRQGTEDLTVTYARVVGSVQLLEAALSISGQSLTLTRDEFVRFAADITDAAGGLERAQQLWSSYFEMFYTESERQQLAISQAQQRAQQQFDAAGLNVSDFTGDGGLQAFRDLFESLLPSLSAEGVVQYLEMANALGVLIDLTAQASDAVDGISGSLADFMADIDAQLADFAPAPTFAERLAQITANTDTLITRAELLGASEEQIAQIRELGARQYGALIAEQTEAIGRYQDVVLGIRDELADVSGATEFQRAMREIDRQLADNISSLNEAARAAGMQGAAEADLAAAHELAAIRVAQAIARLEERGRSIVEQLYGSQLEQLNEQIALIESGVNSFAGGVSSGFEQVTQAADNAAQAQISAQQRIRDWLDNLLLGELGGLRPRDALAEAQALFDRTLAAALGGDAEAMAALPGLADQLLRLGQQVYASGEPYFDLRDAIREALEQVAALVIDTGTPGGGGTVGGGTPGDPGATAGGDASVLYAERERLQAEQAAAQRRELALELAGIVRDLVIATGDPLVEIADRLGFSMSELIADLGVNLADLTVATATQLGDIAQAMGVNLTELAGSVGVDLGALADRQSLLNDALEAEISGLPQGQRDLLEPLLRDVEEAAALGDTTGVERGIGLMEDAINELSPDLRDMLAPYFAGVAPASAFTEIERLANIDNTLNNSLAAHDQTNYLLGEILANGSLQPGGTLGGGIGPVTPGGLPPPSYAVGTTYVPRDGLAMIHAGEAVIPAPVNQFMRNWLGVSQPPRIRPGPIVGGGGAQSNDALIRELQELRRERREADEYTRRLEERLRSLETTTASSARDSVAALDRQTDAMRRTR